ncbi:MAG: choice-of-anchor Q domain-containing protein [Pirellulales bacterium]
MTRSHRCETLERRQLLSITVNTLIDELDGSLVDGDVSLRDALAAAAPGDTIDFSVEGTIVLTLGELAVDRALTIDGPGAALLVIDASGNDPTPASTLFDADPLNDGDGSRVMQIDDLNDGGALDVVVRGVTLTGGDVAGVGGAILSRENLRLIDSVVSGNVATSGGGGIYDQRFSFFGESTIERSTITGNEAYFGGGVVLKTGYYGRTELQASTVAGNRAVHSGGGVFLRTDYGGETVVAATTVSGNTAQSGGGIWNSTYSLSERVEITDSTVSGNTADVVGGGLYNFNGRMELRYSTVTLNGAPNGAGSGVASYGDVYTQTLVASTIIAGNQNSDVDVAGSTLSFLSAGYNLIGDGSGMTGFSGSDTTGVADPLLGTLSDNGGPTLTHAPQPGSPAFDAGDPSAAAGTGDVPQFDQRGSGYPRVLGGRIDVGAVELMQAQTITVDTLIDELDGSIDDGDVSLRDAIAAAGPGDTIDFAVTGTIVLTLGELAISDDLTIAGPGADVLTIDASGNDPTPGSTLDDGNSANDGDGTRVFKIHVPAKKIDVTVTDLTLTGGDVYGTGGAVFTSEQLRLERVIAEHNVATEAGGAVAIVADFGSQTYVVDCAIRENESLRDGGGIAASAADDGVVTISGCEIVDNTSYFGAGGGGLSVLRDSAVTVVDSVISGNTTSGGFGGGGLVLSAPNGGAIEVSRSVVADNTSDGHAGGVFAWAAFNGAVRIAESAVRDNSAVNYAGGILAYTIDVTARLDLDDLTITGNSTDGHGGGLVAIALGAGETIEIQQVTVSDNHANGSGGGIWSHKSAATTVAIRHSTVSGNVANADQAFGGMGGGLFVNGSNGVLLDHTIVAANQRGDGSDDDVTGVAAAASAFNLVGVDTGLSGITTGGNGNQIGTAATPIDPLLGPLADNGGAMLPDGSVLRTHALLPGSSAFDAGDPAAEAGVGGVRQFDERGAPYDRVLGAAIDIGAFEADPAIYNLADGNLDGVVDGLDYLIWATHFDDDPALDPPGAPRNGDYNNDGVVDGLDYLVWATNFGATASPTSGVRSVTADSLAISAEDDGIVRQVTTGRQEHGGDDIAVIAAAYDRVFEQLARARRRG